MGTPGLFDNGYEPGFLDHRGHPVSSTAFRRPGALSAPGRDVVATVDARRASRQGASVMRLRVAMFALAALTGFSAPLIGAGPEQASPAAPAQPPSARGQAAGPSKWALALETDPADLKRYRDANEKLPPPAAGENRVVFMGDSITDNWAKYFATEFPNKPYIGRGISAETTQQMLIRFRPDVIDLKPKVVVILAGTNDIAGNTGRSTQKMIQDNLISMVELAKYNGIKVVLMSVLPAGDYWWQRGMEPAEKIVALNAWIKDYASKNGIVYVDVHTPMSDDKHAMKAELSRDGVHPGPEGYAIMSALVQKAIDQTLAAK
jgi:lysophospholipase L1-like esterase